MPSLGSLVDVNPSAPPPDGAVGLVSLADIDTLTATATPQMLSGAEEAGSARRVARVGDVLFARISPSMENGKVAIVPELETGVTLVSGELFVLRPKPGVDPRLIWAFLRQRPLLQYLRSSLVGSSRQRLDRETLERTELPREGDQKWESAVAALEQLDLAVAARRSTTDLLRRLPGVVASRAAAEAPRTTLGNLDATLRSGTRERSVETGEWAMLRNPDLLDGSIDDTNLRFLPEHAPRPHPLHSGDLLVVRSTGSRETFCTAAIYEDQPPGADFASSLARIRYRQPGSDFLWAWLQTNEARAACFDLATGTTSRYNLTLPALRRLPVPRLDSGAENRLGELARELRLTLAAANSHLELLLIAIQAHLAREFAGTRLVEETGPEAVAVPGDAVPDELRLVFEAASPVQRTIWEAVMRGESLRLDDLASERERARLQHTMAVLEQLGLVIREQHDVVETWHLPDAETELVG